MFQKYSVLKNQVREMVSVMFFLCLAAASPVKAGFSQSSPGMAGQSLGGGYSAKADDPSALFLNSAGLSQAQQTELSLSYSKPFAGLPGVSFQQGYAAMVLPMGQKWTLGLGGSTFDADGLLTEQEGALGLAFQTTRRLSLGVSATYLRHSYNVSGEAADDPLFSKGRAKGAPGVDVGALYHASRRVSLALSGRHLNRPDVGLVSKDLVPLEALAGARVRLGPVNLLADVMLRDAGQEVAYRREITWAAGTEWTALSNLLLRAGLNRGSLTTGFGLVMGNMRLDYSFALSSVMEQDNAGGHHAALSYKLGKSRAPKISKKDKKPSTSKAPPYSFLKNKPAR
jgi:hypothetical protein